MLVRFLVLELLFQALSRYSKILVYTCISTIFCSRTVILQLLVVQVVWFLLQFLCLRCIARSAYVQNIAADIWWKFLCGLGQEAEEAQFPDEERPLCPVEE